MRLRLEADPGEVREKAPRLLQELAKAVRSEDPNLAEALEKAAFPDIPDTEAVDPMVRAAADRMTLQYSAMLDDMLAEMARVLDAAVSPPKEGVRKALADAGYPDRFFAPGGLLHGLQDDELASLAKAVTDADR